MADLLGVGVEEVDGYRRGVRRPSEAVGERIDAVWRLLRAGRTGLTSADVDDAVNAGRSRSGPEAGSVGVSGQARGMSDVSPAVNYLAEGLNADELEFVSEALASDPAAEPGAEPVPWGEGPEDLDLDELEFVSEALASDPAAEPRVEQGAGVDGVRGLDPADLRLLSEALESSAFAVVTSPSGDGGSRNGFADVGGRGEVDTDVAAPPGPKRRRVGDGGQSVTAPAAVVQAAGESAAAVVPAPDGGPAKLLLQVRLERVRDGLRLDDGVDPLPRLAKVLRIDKAARVQAMLSGALLQTGVPRRDIERIGAASSLLNEQVAVTAEAVDERVRARMTPIQRTLEDLMKEASKPGRTAEGVRFSNLLQAKREVADYRFGTRMPTMKVGERINAVKRLFDAEQFGLTPKDVEAEVDRYRRDEERGVDFAGKLVYLRRKLGGVGASAKATEIPAGSMRAYLKANLNSQSNKVGMDVAERVDKLYRLYRELDEVAEESGLPADGTLNPFQAKVRRLRQRLGKDELDGLLKAYPGEVSRILSDGGNARVQLAERTDAAYGLLMERAAVTADAVDQRVRDGWTPFQKTMVYLLGSLGARRTQDVLKLNESLVRRIRSGVQRPGKEVGDRMRALERLLRARDRESLPTRDEMNAAVGAMPAYDLKARVAYLVLVTGSAESLAIELNSGRKVGENGISSSALKRHLSKQISTLDFDVAEQIDRACHEFWRLGFRPADAELAEALRGEVAAAMAAGSAVGSVGGGDGTLARLAGRGRLAGERTQVGYAWRWFRDGAGREVVRLT
ncbi:hypothetical protein ABZZ20_36580, partial [Streptomyces sp. NPDC006430]|uniref:hypothetical protein n=1 Tax=Streptomyces sp. NPDC006430 TaxID=3154299 RepID=UPI0033A997C3